MRPAIIWASRLPPRFPFRADDPEALDMLDRALQNPPDIHTGVDNVNAKRPQGNTQDQALRRLRKDAPELHLARF